MPKTINLDGHNFTVMTQAQAKDLYNRFLRSNTTSLYEAYERPSRAKENAYEYCRDLERRFNSWDGVITGYNTCTFSYAFTGEMNGVRYFVYITKDYDRIIPMDSLQ